MKRRDVIKSAGLFAGAVLLDRCGKGSTGKIDTVVYLMMENRSYDHLLGARSMLEGLPGDGLQPAMSNLDSNGSAVRVFSAPNAALCVPDPPHSWGSSHLQFNSGANDGFLTQHEKAHPGDLSAMQYLTRADVPVTWSLADSYATCDRWFASVMGPTWPNRYYFLSGTSLGQQDDTVPKTYSAPTIFGRLADKGLTSRIYYSDVPFASLLGKADFDLERTISPIAKFHDDAKSGTLPNVSYVDPPFAGADDHPPHHPILGQQVIADVYNSLANSPQWERSLLLVTYDEHGGFFDHVPPPTIDDDLAAQGFGQLGFRVPAVLIGPYVKSGYVSSVVRNHASALRQLETLFGTAPLTTRTQVSPDLSEMIDLVRLANNDPRKPAAIPAVDTSGFTIGDSCAANTFAYVGPMEVAARQKGLIESFRK